MNQTTYTLSGIPYHWDPFFLCLRKVAAHAPAGAVGVKGKPIGGQFVKQRSNPIRLSDDGRTVIKDLPAAGGRRESATQAIGSLLGQGDLYLETSVIPHPQRRGMAQVLTAYKPGLEQPDSPDPGALSRGLLLDWLHGNRDRNPGNVLRHAGGSFKLIDHERTHEGEDLSLMAGNSLAKLLTGATTTADHRQRLADTPLHPEAVELGRGILSNHHRILSLLDEGGIPSDVVARRIGLLKELLDRPDPKWGDFLPPSLKKSFWMTRYVQPSRSSGSPRPRRGQSYSRSTWGSLTPQKPASPQRYHPVSL